MTRPRSIGTAQNRMLLRAAMHGSVNAGTYPGTDYRSCLRLANRGFLVRMPDPNTARFALTLEGRELLKQLNETAMIDARLE